MQVLKNITKGDEVKVTEVKGPPFNHPFFAGHHVTYFTEKPIKELKPHWEEVDEYKIVDVQS